jgi:hypothetical protein
MPKLGKIFCLMAAVALWQGCSSTSDNGDAALSDASTAGDVPSVFLSRGMNNYVVTQVSGVTDGCMIHPNSLKNMTLLVNFVESTQTLSVGTPVGSPLVASLGTGVVGTTGTLNRVNDVTDGACTWHQTNVSVFTLTGGDVFTLDVTENQSNFGAQCAPPNTTCTSTYTFTFANPTPVSTDGGTGG